MSFERVEVVGSIPTSRFGHTTTVINKTKVIMYGGATGNTGQFSITDNTYLLEIPTNTWKKLESSGTTPSPRAAHAATAISNVAMVMFGGATGSGGLASDELFKLELKDNTGVWEVIETVGKGPGKRYGHIMCFLNNYLVVFGGNTGEKSVSDCWLLNLDKKSPLSWVEIKSPPEKTPNPRVYHSAAVCPMGTAKGMIVVFGGRGADGSALNDSWGLRRHTEGNWDWVKAPYQGDPSPRYQHSVIFVGTIMLVIGGRANVVNETLPMDVYDTVTSNWYKFNSPQRFRSGAFLIDTLLHIYGGFELSTPNIPTDSLIRVNLMNLFSTKSVLKQKIAPFEARTIETVNNSKPSTPVMPERGSAIIGAAMGTDKTPRVVPEKNLKEIFDPKKGLSSREDLPLMFLNVLCQPEQHHNTEAIRFNFKPSQIISLIQMVKEIVMEQPIVIKVKAPVKIFGDIHGQLSDLLNFFRMFGSPFLNGRKNDVENFDYVFLGDFVDRGSHSLETICLLMSLKAICPKSVHLIRGNHEDHQINCTFGFIDECIDKCKDDPSDPNSIFNHMNRFFEWLPLAAVVEDRILCLHGGIGASVKSLDDIMRIKRPVDISHEVTSLEQQIILDILWSDPTESDADTGIHANFMRDPHETGNIVKFGPDVVHDFLKRNNLSMIVRAHECVMDGFQRFAGGALITVFSATDYCRRHKNAGAILIVKTNMEIVPKLIYPSNNNENNWKDDDEDLKRRPPTPPRWRSPSNRN